MGVNRQPVVGMGAYLVASLSNFGKRIHVHRHNNHFSDYTPRSVLAMERSMAPWL